MFKTVKNKFIAITIILIILSIGMPTVFLLAQFQENFKQRSTIMLQTTLDLVRNCIFNEMMQGDKDIQKVVDKFSRNHSVNHVRIINKDGLIRFSSNSFEVNRLIEEIDPHHVNWNKLREGKASVMIDGKNYAVTEPMYNEKVCQRCHKNKLVIAYLDIDTYLTKAENYFYTGSLHIILLAIVITISLILVFYYVFHYFIDKPLKNFIAALEEVERGNLSVRVSAENDDEFGTLDRHFNRMVSKLETSQQAIENFHFEQLRQADKLVTIGELTAEMAHEINNPIAIMMSRVDYLQLEAQDNKNLAAYSDDLNVILNQITKLSRITGSILKYSKKLPKNFSAIDLKEVAAESLAVLEPRIKKKAISVHCNYECKDSLIFGDSLQIEQMLTNIFNNAIDAMDKNGRLDIHIFCLDNDRVQIDISDTGTGIENNSKDQLFSPFFTTKSADKGTGLGLYIVSKVCKNHNAEINVKSQPGEGATFTILFPKFKE